MVFTTCLVHIYEYIYSERVESVFMTELCFKVPFDMGKFDLLLDGSFFSTERAYVCIDFSHSFNYCDRVFCGVIL